MKGQKKKENGITLIALVISIIVMLILAGVSINALMGDNGILKQAQFASFMSEMAAVEEAVQLWGADHYDDANHSIPANGIVPTTEIDNSERLSGEVGYYREWSRTNTMPTTSITTEASNFNGKFSVELVRYPGGIEDLYYLDNDGLNLTSNKKYLIDAVNSMIYSVQGISLNGVRCYSLAMAKAVMNGTYDVPAFAEAEVSGSTATGGVRAAGNTEPRYILDEDGNEIENPNYNPNGFQIIADSTNNNIYKLYNNGDLYAKGIKGPLLNTSSTEMEKINGYKWSKLTLPDVIPGYNTNNVEIIMGSSTMYVIDTNKDLWAWGDNSSNKLGLSDRELKEYTGMEATKLNIGGTYDASGKVVGSKSVYKVFPSSSQTFVVTVTNGTYELYASGVNSCGELGTGEEVSSTESFKKVNFTNPQNITYVFGSYNQSDVIMTGTGANTKIYYAGSTTKTTRQINLFTNTTYANKNIKEFIEIGDGTIGAVAPATMVDYKPSGNDSMNRFVSLDSNGKVYWYDLTGYSEITIGTSAGRITEIKTRLSRCYYIEKSIE